MNDVKIVIRETINTGRTITIPVLPEKIDFDSNGTNFATYNILDLGEIKIPNGDGLRTVAWESIFPGENHQLPPQLLSTSSVYKPKQYQTILSEWEKYGTPLKILITGTPINMDVYLKRYAVKYAGAFGDYEYRVEFIENREITISSVVVKKTEKKETTGETRPTEKTTTYTVVKGDNLWSISKRLLKDATRWQEIYNLNKSAIESTAKKYGKKSSNNGHWIYPGTVLKIPS